MTAPIETPPAGSWPDVDCDEYGQMTCPIPSCDEQLNLERAYSIPLIAMTDGAHSIHGAVADDWRVECIGGHVLYTSTDHARRTGGDETSETAVEYDHHALHRVINMLGGERL